MPDDAIDTISARVQRLEESHGFAEHTTQQLSQHLVALTRQLDEAARRIASLEDRFRTASAPHTAETDGHPSEGTPSPGLSMDS